MPPPFRTRPATPRARNPADEAGGRRGTKLPEMPARVLLTVLALITGGYQVVDGIHVLATGVYMGSATPGPWRHVIHATGIDPMDFGPGFVALGVCWLVAVAMLLSSSSRRAWW